MICSFTSAKDCCRALCAQKAWRVALEDDRLWKTFCREEYALKSPLAFKRQQLPTYRSLPRAFHLLWQTVSILAHQRKHHPAARCLMYLPDGIGVETVSFHAAGRHSLTGRTALADMAPLESAQQWHGRRLRMC